MRQVLLVFLALALFVLPARAEDSGDSTVYQITDVAVDVTAGTAAQARDQAIMQAQRAAFDQLLGRLGADASMAAKQDDNTIAALVQAFEVQQERTSAVRYVGTFTVQFKPNAVRSFLNRHGTTFSETRSRPVVVLPVLMINGRAVLWEDQTPWRLAWEGAMRGSGLVPLVVPSGDLEDIAVISTIEAVNGKPESLQNIMNKYQAGSAVVAVLDANLDNPDPKKEMLIEARRYDASGKTAEPVHLSLPAAADSKAALASMNEGVKQLRNELESGWKQSTKLPKGPVGHLSIAVPIASLADWNAIKAKLAAVPNVARANVITMTRNAADIDLEFRGDIPQLQSALGEQGLSLDQSAGTGGWMLTAGTSMSTQ